MKNFFFLIFLFSQVAVNAQNLRNKKVEPPPKSTLSKKAGDFINVNTPEYPQSKMEIGDLVKNVLVSGVSSCFGSVTEFRVRPVLPATNPSRSWGYFNKGTTDFPFDDGIVLMTGPAKYAGNFFSYPPLKGKLYTKGDLDLSKGISVENSLLVDAGETTQKITVEKAGIYKVTISNGGCIKTFSAVASYIPVPIVEDIIYEKNTLTVKVKDATSTMEYSINKGVNWQSSNVFNNILPNVNYFLSVRIPGDVCFATEEYFTFFVNNVITPNSDGINDDLDFSGVSKYRDFSAVIIDRYGKEVFRATPKNSVWKANKKQSAVPSGSYFYQVSWSNNTSNAVIQKSGWILIKNRN